MSKMKVRLHALRLAILVLTLAPTVAPGQAAQRDGTKHPPEYTFKVVRQFPHDPTAFTQGLAYRDGYFYEGTGLNGRSSLRQIRVQTGEVVRQVDLAAQFFGEGVTLLGNEVIQLTWQSHIGFVYQLGDLHWMRSFSYSGEGWGITTDGRQIFMSDGSPEIHVLDSSTFLEKRRLKVHDGSAPVAQLNELEFVEGEIFANVWHSDRIARISPQTGEVVGWIDLTGLLSLPQRSDPDAVLNGIAYNPQGKRLFVTGKLWPAIFEIQVIPKHPR
jgi:glutaminyl-peptide cyclotransferase